MTLRFASYRDDQSSRGDNAQGGVSMGDHGAAMSSLLPSVVEACMSSASQLLLWGGEEINISEGQLGVLGQHFLEVGAGDEAWSTS